jgi:DNA polymerase III alpha subunit
MKPEDATTLFEQIEAFASYCFNRSHSAAYAFVAYQTAYLKCHYPVEYLSALLSSVSDDKDQTQLYIEEANRYGIKVLPPDINKSVLEYAPDGKNIRFGLAAIKQVGEPVVEAIVKEREENGEFKRNIRCKVGLSYSFARKVPMTKPFADNSGTMTKDDLFQKYWGLSKNASENWSNQNSKNRNINQKDCSEDMNLKASSEKSPSFSSYFNRNDSNHTENCTDLHKLKKRCYGNDLFEKEHTLSQLSCSDSQILQQTSLTNEDVNNDKHEDSSMSKKVAMSLDSSIEILVSESKIKVVGCSNNNPTMEQSESTVSVIMWGDSDSSSYASKQQV